MKYYTPTKLSENMHVTPEGYLVCVGVPITRTGGLTYGEGETPLETDADGKILIYRDAENVFHADTMASFEGKPVTINHPQDFISPENWSYLAKGTVQNVRPAEGDDPQHLIADLLITDKMAIQLVKNGLREVSCGYEAEYTQTGEGEGKQTKIIGNHIALVQRGRAGREFRINDHEGKGTHLMAKFKDLLEKLHITAKAVDEEMKKDDEKKDDKKEEKKEPAKDESAEMTQLMAMLKEITDKVESMQKAPAAPAEEAPASDEKKEEPKNEEKKEDSKDDSEAESEPESDGPSVEERLGTIETAIQKILEALTEEESGEEETESQDAAISAKTGDTAQRAEILAPGIQPSKDIKAKALKIAYGTKQGKDVIHSLTGNKAPAYDSASAVDQLFIATSELLRAKRANEMSETKKVTDSDTSNSNVMTPAKLNEINRAYYAQK